jgi:chromosome segregation ATPase
MTPENDVNVAQPEVDDIEVEVTEDESQVEQSASNDDELENYTKSVSKRINKLNARNRETEERAAQLEAALRQREQEVHAYYQQATNAQQSLLAKEEETVEIKEREANELYKKAHASGDADLMSKADSLKSDVALAKEKVRIARQRQEQADVNTQQPQPQPQQQYYEQTQQAPQPSQKALNWLENNPWFEENAEANTYAGMVHNSLAGEGYDTESDEYYEELSNRIYKVYPDLRSDNANQIEDRPAVQRVASASVGSRQKTQGKQNGVRFTKSEVEMAQSLKPHGMSDEQWLKKVAVQKQAIQNRESK